MQATTLTAIDPFAESKKHFDTQLQELQFYDKYSRFSRSKERRETWKESIDRAVDYLKELGGNRIPERDYKRIGSAMQNMDAFCSMRLFAMAGGAARRQNASIYNCFGRETRFVTESGIKSFNDFSDGDKITVLTHTGEWKEAVVRQYGQQSLYRIKIKRLRQEVEIRATKNHRWILSDGTVTDRLQSGDSLLPMPSHNFNYWESAPLERMYWCYGFVYGDGTLVKNENGIYKYSMVRLCGNDVRYLERFEELGFTSSTSASLQGDVIVYTGSYLKELPDLERDNPCLIKAFVNGYLAADGKKNRSDTTHNEYDSIQTSDAQSFHWLRNALPMAGIFIQGEDDYTGQKTNYGTRGDTIRFRINTNMHTDSTAAKWYVKSINKDTAEEDVWCLEVDGDHSFVLPDCGISTGNCSYLPVDSIDSFVEVLLLSMSGTGVGYSVESRYINQLPSIPSVDTFKNGSEFVIPDTTEGWCEALRTGLEHWFSGKDITFDYSQIRPAGSVLKTKGGRASGPAPLKRLLEFSREKIKSARGRRLKPIEAHDIVTMIASCAVSGGSRRAAQISLFDFDDEEMLHAKDSGWWKFAPQRSNANNSAVWPKRKLNKEEVRDYMMVMHDGGGGEPGIYIRRNAQKYSGRRDPDVRYGTNPCGEINLKPREFCNLSQAILRKGDDFHSVKEKVEIATIIGCIQSTATHFPGLNNEWSKNSEEERLIGVDLTGQLDNPELITSLNLEQWQKHAISTAEKYSEMLGINMPAATTCIKPSGNSSVLFDCSPGLHSRWSDYYIRRMRVNANSPIRLVLESSGVNLHPENGQEYETADTLIVEFPVKSPEGAITNDDRSALEQCEWWLKNKLFWTEHNPSATITYTEDELPELIDWVYEHQDHIGGLSFLEKDNNYYPMAPYESISKEEYENRIEDFPEINFSLLEEYENDDWTTVAQELACFAGQCEI